MLLYLGQKPNWIVIQLKTELQLPETLYLICTIKRLEIPLSFKRKIKSIKTYVRDISIKKECSVNYNKNPEFRYF